MLVEQIDRLDAQASEGCVSGLLDQLGPAGKETLATGIGLPELGGDDDLIADGRDRVP